jgi:hypothetical protein
MPLTAREVLDRLRDLGSPEAAAFAARYFKSGPDQYGEGDVFLGIRVPVLRKLAADMATSGTSTRHSRPSSTNAASLIATWMVRSENIGGRAAGCPRPRECDWAMRRSLGRPVFIALGLNLLLSRPHPG